MLKRSSRLRWLGPATYVLAFALLAGASFWRGSLNLVQPAEPGARHCAGFLIELRQGAIALSRGTVVCLDQRPQAPAFDFELRSQPGFLVLPSFEAVERPHGTKIWHFDYPESVALPLWPLVPLWAILWPLWMRLTARDRLRLPAASPA